MAGNRLTAITGYLLFLLVVSAPIASAETSSAIVLRWTFAVFRDNADQGNLFAVTEDQTLRSGDYIKFFARSDSPCHVYWIHLDSQRQLHLLWPRQPSASGHSLPAGYVQFIPSGSEWFRLDDHPGEERFYLLASVSRLTRLERLFSALSHESGTQTPSHIKAVLNEIRDLRWKHRNFKRAAERPPTIMGQVRNGQQPLLPDLELVKSMATLVHAERFYSKVFTIDHQ
jgi:hypothetical protein